MNYAATVVAFLTGMSGMALIMSKQQYKGYALIVAGAIVVEILLALAKGAS